MRGTESRRPLSTTASKDSSEKASLVASCAKKCTDPSATAHMYRRCHDHVPSCRSSGLQGGRGSKGGGASKSGYQPTVVDLICCRIWSTTTAEKSTPTTRVKPVTDMSKGSRRMGY